MKPSSHKSKSAEPLIVKLPEKEPLDLEELLRLLPIPIHRTSLWPYLRTLCGCGCNCCCCCDRDCGCHGSSGGPNPPASPAAPATPGATAASVTLNVLIRQNLIGASLGVRADFNWVASGPPGLTVNIEVKSSVTYPVWTTILSGQPPVDLASWLVHGLPRETFHFRAVAMDSQGNRVAVSAIITP